MAASGILVRDVVFRFRVGIIVIGAQNWGGINKETGLSQKSLLPLAGKRFSCGNVKLGIMQIKSPGPQ
jgi:hypothetical protein